MKRIIYLLIIAVVSEVSLAQGTFKVLVTKGQNSIKSKDGNWDPIKTGMNLDDKVEIKLGDKPYLGLIHSSGFNIVLNEAGSHSLQDLITEKKENSVLKKYMTFIDRKMNETGPSNRLEATGAVERAMNENISIYLPKRATYNENDVIISWSDVEEVKYFTVQISNMLGEVLFKRAVDRNMVRLDLSNKKFESPVLLLNVKSDNGSVSSDDYAIVPVNSEKNDSFSKELEELRSSIDEENALDAIGLAEFYRRNDCMVDAGTYYRKAIEKAPDVEYFQDLFQDFTSQF